MNLRPTQLLLRCYAEQIGDQWQAICLDLTLAAQGDSYEQVRNKLRAMIADYVFDAVSGEDQAYAEQLLRRKAPLRDWLKYYVVWLRNCVPALTSAAQLPFQEALPLAPPNPKLRPA